MKVRSTGADGVTTEREVPDQVFTFPEGGMWIAAWRHYDAVAQGETEEEATDTLIRTMGLQCLWDAMDGRKPYEGVKAAPAAVLAEWERKHRESHLAQEGGDGT